jgi:hypothetical protein
MVFSVPPHKLQDNLQLIADDYCEVGKMCSCQKIIYALQNTSKDDANDLIAKMQRKSNTWRQCWPNCNEGDEKKKDEINNDKNNIENHYKEKFSNIDLTKKNYRFAFFINKIIFGIIFFVYYNFYIKRFKFNINFIISTISLIHYTNLYYQKTVILEDVELVGHTIRKLNFIFLMKQTPLYLTNRYINLTPYYSTFNNGTVECHYTDNRNKPKLLHEKHPDKHFDSFYYRSLIFQIQLKFCQALNNVTNEYMHEWVYGYLEYNGNYQIEKKNLNNFKKLYPTPYAFNPKLFSHNTFLELSRLEENIPNLNFNMIKAKNFEFYDRIVEVYDGYNYHLYRTIYYHFFYFFHDLYLRFNCISYLFFN